MAHGYQHVFLTGPPGIGKTTIIEKVCKELRLKSISMKGFFTAELREDGKRVGFDIISLDGNRCPLARIGEGTGPKVGQYVVKSFESVALPILQTEMSHVTVLDEVGKMELFSQRFELAVKNVFATNTSILGTIPLQKGRPIPLVEFIRTHPSVKLFTVDYKNRDSVPYEIVNLLASAGESHGKP
ncbi:cancer-related nucleoside-triphosphatase homolog isoform X2 [Thrips palmi]|uniref:Cancer-related nucleoside-triphosphatase homolog isoform X2 n=1 Tax=Thrips palmi TaxID=161013 RepID=A0A6P8YVR6_THRPL|nr:cancer-related nucleoside-triphosphatase homolog isoform X2 [Thrips palmi]